MLLFTLPLFAQESPKTTSPDLVKQAEAAKAKRKKSSTKVLTNKDVKNSKGKITVLPPSEKPVVKGEKLPTIAEQDASYKERKEATARFDEAKKKVDTLQKELDTIEQRYYEENDPNYRDNVIQQRFQQTKRQLQDAQHDLADARDVLQKIAPTPQK